MKIYISIDHLRRITAYTDSTEAVDLDILVEQYGELSELWLKYDPAEVGSQFRAWQIKQGQRTLPGLGE